MLQARYQRGTKDSDVLQTAQLSPDVSSRLIQLAGVGTAIHQRRNLYLDVVSSGVPFLPQKPRWVALEQMNASLDHFDLRALGIVDVVVSKLKRFSANDASDIEAMIDLGLVPHAELISRFLLALDNFCCDARAEDLPEYVANLHRVERDMLAVEETRIDLPDWI